MMGAQEKVYHHTRLLTYLIMHCSARDAIIAKAWVIFYTDRRVSKMKSQHDNTLLLEDLILSEKNLAFSSISRQLILLHSLYDNYMRGEGATREEIHKCHEELLNEIWESMFLEQKLREKYKEVGGC